MSKGLIEKAFEKWAEKHKTGVESKRDEVTAKTAFIAGATWQREQLIAELREWVNSNEGRIETDGKTWYKLVNGTDLLAKLDDLLEKGGC
jgi:hypothetical protein